MTIKYANLCSVILKQFFGENVQLVADALFASVSRSIPTLTKTTNLSRNEVCMALAILIKFRLAKYEPSLVNESVAEYSINREQILYIIRYPKYVQLMQAKYGDMAADITEEILRCGTQTCSSILLKCFASRENKGTLQSYRDEFFKMIEAGYLKRIPVPKKESEDPVPTLQLQETEIFQTPEIDLQQLTLIHSGRKIESKDSGVYWQVNFQRFHQDLRDAIMTLAIEKKLGANAADCFRFLLVQMYERTDPWQQEYSNPFTFVEIKQAVEKKSNNMELVKYLDQFVSLIADDSINFIRKIGDTGGGQYIVELKKGFEELALCCTEHVITEKFGSKASRIFRVIKAKKYIEQEDIQKEAMVPAKEAKLLTYKLFEEQFIQIKTIRKAGGGGSGPAKAFYLFHVNNTQVVKMLLDICYKAFYNSLTRSNFEKHTNKRLIEKSQKLENIVETIKERGQSDEYIAEIMETLTPPEREILDKVKTRIKTLSNAELAIDDTIFLLQMYLYYHSTTRK